MTDLFFSLFLTLFPAESDLVTFISIKNHFKTDFAISTSLFTVQTRTDTLRKMYENAAKTPVPAIEAMDELLGNRDRRSSDAFICTPILGQVRRRMRGNIDIEIETRMVKTFSSIFLRQRRRPKLSPVTRVFINIYLTFSCFSRLECLQSFPKHLMNHY